MPDTYTDTNSTPVPVVGNVPRYATFGDAGADLIATEDVWISHGEFKLIGTGTSVAIPEGHFGLVAGRSGLGIKHGIALVNGIGVIDAGYRGEIKVGLINHGSQPFKVNAGDRVAQLIIVPFVSAHFAPVLALPESERGTDGFGSTGVRS
ncbi:dUTP diphosphatase [Microbacterium trichothecenolyticum]|uniref:dUTP diphosphatase n=1 Tax=Microbacterium trichothecenolyticum TaxID=69370 RepID=UPI0005ED24C9